VVLTPAYCLKIEPKHSLVDDPLSVIEDCFEKFSDFHSQSTSGSELPLHCFGALSYDSARFFEPTAGITPNTSDPDLLAFFPGCSLRFDRENYELSAWASEKEHRVLSKIASIEPSDNYLGSFSLPTKVSKRFSDQEFIDKVEQAKEYIAAGDAFQIVLSNNFRASMPNPDPLKTFSLLANKNPSPFHFCAKSQHWAMVGASPEVYLRGQDQEFISMRLVAGTYPRIEGKDEQQKGLLASNPKEKAEHYMLVDHARNDIGRSSLVGSVEPRDLLTVETYRDVHHLVSEVRGKPVKSLLECFKHCFPIATLTGTPKVRAMQIIEELEGSRGMFGGSVFKLGTDGSLDSSVIIRSITMENGTASVKAGCGVVYDSDPERENSECGWKAEALFGKNTKGRIQN